MIRPTSWRHSSDHRPSEKSGWFIDAILALVVRYTDWADRRRRP